MDMYTVAVVPDVLPEGQPSHELGAFVRIVATNGKERHDWCAICDCTMIDDLSGLVGSFALDVAKRVRRGNTVVLPGFFDLNQISGWIGRYVAN